jgi:hypothetical protein
MSYLQGSFKTTQWILWPMKMLCFQRWHLLKTCQSQRSLGKSIHRVVRERYPKNATSCTACHIFACDLIFLLETDWLLLVNESSNVFDTYVFVNLNRSIGGGELKQKTKIASKNIIFKIWHAVSIYLQDLIKVQLWNTNAQLGLYAFKAVVPIQYKSCGIYKCRKSTI